MEPTGSLCRIFDRIDALDPRKPTFGAELRQVLIELAVGLIGSDASVQATIDQWRDEFDRRLRSEQGVPPAARRPPNEDPFEAPRGSRNGDTSSLSHLARRYR